MCVEPSYPPPRQPSSPADSIERERAILRALQVVLERPLAERAACLRDLRLAHDVERDVEALVREDELGAPSIEPGEGVAAFVRARASAEVGKELAGRAGEPPVLQGHYRLLRVVGEGGSGVVYEAEQDFPRRRVALKAIRTGRSSPRALQHFEREAQALALLQHPGIAHIHEAVRADPESSDEAYLVMELVDGPTLTTYARQRSASMRERVALLVAVCEAVHHAHQRGVIHCDLKPHNVLVDSSGQPKVLDFGIARIVDSKSALRELSGAGQLAGTLPYMSPEQLAGDPHELDAQTDVYALGVMLFELSTGRVPHSTDLPLPELTLAIRDRDAPRASTYEPRIDADLDAIVAMALSKTKTRRYTSVADFAADLRRWQRGEAVVARGDSRLYTAQKFVRRNRLASAVAAGALIVLIAFGVQSRVQAAKETRLRQIADAATAQADANSRSLARTLHTSEVERGRLLAASGSFESAETLLWNEHLARSDASTHWALWELYARHSCVATWTSGDGAVLSLDAALDGQRVVSGAHAGAVRTWDARNGESRSITNAAESVVHSVAFAARGDIVCVSTDDGEILVYDTRANAELWRRRSTVRREVRAFACARAARRAAIAWSASEIEIVDLANGRVLENLAVESADLACLAFDDAGDDLACALASGRIYVHAFAAERSPIDVQELVPDPRLVRWSPTGTALACLTGDGTIVLADARTVRVVSRAPNAAGTPDEPRGLDFSLDGQELMAWANSGFDVWNVARPEEPVRAFHVRMAIFSAIFAPGGKGVITGLADGTLRTWELEGPAFPRVLPIVNTAGALLAFSQVGRTCASAAQDGHLDVWPIEGGPALASASTTYGPFRAITYDLAATRLATIAIDGKCEVWDAERLTPRAPPQLAGVLPSTLRFSTDGSMLACALSRGGLRVCDTASGALSWSAADDMPPIERIAYGPDGSMIATAHRERIVALWDAASHALTRQITSPRSISALTFVPQRDELIVGTWDGVVDVWKLPELTLVRSLEGHTQRVSSISMRRDGSLFATASKDGFVRLWDSRADACLLALEADRGAVTNVAFTFDGTALRSVHADGAVLEWDLARYDRSIEANRAAQELRVARDAAAPR